MPPRIVPQLRRRYPDLKLYVREEIPSTLARSLDEARWTFACCRFPRRRGHTTVPLFREPIYVAFSSDHALASRKTVRPEDLAGQEVLTLGEGFQLHHFVEDLCRDLGAHLRLDYEGTSLDTLPEMVATGLAMTFLPALYLKTVVCRDPILCTAPLHGRPLYRPIGMMWRKTAASQQRYEELANLSRDVIEAELQSPTAC